MSADIWLAFIEGLKQSSLLGLILWPILNCLDSLWQAFKSELIDGGTSNETRQDN